MNETRYLVDNNALLRVKSERIRSDFFQTYCRVTADVLWEAGDHPARDAIEAVAIDASPRMLSTIREVMVDEAPGDTAMIDLYKNQGAADPGLLAAAVMLTANEQDDLLPDTWAVVTDDLAVRARTDALGIEWISAEDLAQRIDESIGADELS